MAKKRKHDAKSTETVEPPQKQQQQEPRKEEPPVEPETEELHENIEEVEEEYEEEYEEVEEEEKEEKEEEEDDDNDDDGQNAADDQTAKNTSTSATASSGGADQVGHDDEDDDDDDDEPIPKLLEPFNKDQLINLLREVADNHSDVADRIRKLADEDPVHRKIFVHGLGWDTNAETLIDVFKQYGEIEDCKAVSDKVSGKSKGYGFILFKTRSGARKALKLPQKKIGNRMTSCQLASIGPVPTPNVAPAAPVPPVSEYTQRKIYVSNVGAELDPQKLLTFFSKYGEIEEGPLGLDKATGKPKGFCLFVYRSVESAKKALEEPHKNFEGHILHCQKAIDGPKPGKSQHQHQHQHHRNAHNANAQRNENPGFAGRSAAGQGHLMAPAGGGIGFNQGAAAAQALNPALGQALTALLATQGGLGLTNLLGTLGSATAVNPGVPGTAPGMQGGYANQPNINSGVMGGYPNQQMGQGGSGRGQHGVGPYGGVPPYMGH